MKNILIFALLFTLNSYSSFAFAQDSRAKATQQTRPSGDIEVLEDLDYPELQVVPRASQRLTLEANYEKRNFWYVHWPFYLSAITTILSTQQQSSNLDADISASRRADAKDRLSLASTIGYAWLGGMVILSFNRPYAKGLGSLERIGGQSRQASLMRERLAEETLEGPARLISKLKWLSIISNAVANSVALGETNSDGKVFAGVGIFASFLPLIFDHRYEYNFEKHEEYKRKIYAPNIHFDYFKTEGSRFASSDDWVKRVNFTWTF